MFGLALAQEFGRVLSNKSGEKFKICAGCARELSLTWGFSECRTCLDYRDGGGSG